MKNLRKYIGIYSFIVLMSLSQYGFCGDNYYNDYDEVELSDRDKLFLAIEESDFEGMKKLLEIVGVNHEDEDGYTPLRHGICSENLEIVNYLISSGANVNHQECDGYTPLHLFLYIFYKKYMMLYAISINAQHCDSLDLDALSFLSKELNSSSQNFAEIGRALVAAGANVDIKDNENFSAMDFFIEYIESNVDISFIDLDTFSQELITIIKTLRVILTQ